TFGRFEHPLNEYKGVVATRTVHNFYEADAERGFYGGGGIDARFNYGPIAFAIEGLPPDVPSWGTEYKRALRDYYTHSVRFAAHSTSLPMASNTITLDASHPDKWGRPGFRLTYRDHPDDMKAKQWFRDRTGELMH